MRCPRSACSVILEKAAVVYLPFFALAETLWRLPVSAFDALPAASVETFVTLPFAAAGFATGSDTFTTPV